jgi:hypothetical protein
VSLRAAAVAATFAVAAMACSSGPAVAANSAPSLTRWAYAQDSGPVWKTLGSSHPKSAGRLHYLTSDGFPEPYVLLGSRVQDDGTRWAHLRLPGRPNGATGWVKREYLGAYHRVTKALVVNRRLHQLTLFDHGRRVLRVAVGVGKRTTPTPAGHFWITERFRVRGGGIYGPYALGTSAYAPHLTDWPGGGVIGMHGTNEPQLIPGNPSHGCIRLRNADIARVYRRAPIGTPLQIV